MEGGCTKTTTTADTAFSPILPLRSELRCGLVPASPSDRARQLLGLAKSRWLRKSEIQELLLIWPDTGLQCSQKPTLNPPDGFAAIFDRKSTPRWRQDGIPWRRRTNGKVLENHEVYSLVFILVDLFSLRIEKRDCLHVYYAHSEDSTPMHRRAYWLVTDGQYVFVHYRLESRPSSASSSKASFESIPQTQPPSLSLPSNFPHLPQNATQSPPQDLPQSFPQSHQLQSLSQSLAPLLSLKRPRESRRESRLSQEDS